MCRNIHTLYNFEPPATEEEVRSAALQYVRKISGFTKPSQANADGFERAGRGGRLSSQSLGTLRSALFVVGALVLIAVPSAFTSRSSGPALTAAAGQSPHAPGAIVCNRYDNVGTNGTSSQDFETDADAYDDEAADDCNLAAPTVIGGVGVQGVYFDGPGPADSVNVRFYADSLGFPGGTLECARLAQPYNTPSANFEVDFGAGDCSLAAGVHWVSVQARQDF